MELKQKKRNKAIDEELVYGKIPPQAIEIERAILGAIMLEKGLFDSVHEILNPDCFYLDAHRKVYEAMIRLNRKNTHLDTLTVAEELKASDDLDNIGGRFFLTSLTTDVASGAHVESHCRIVLQKYIQRELIRVGGALLSEAYSDASDAFDLLDRVQQQFQEISQVQGMQSVTPIDAVLVDRFKRLHELQKTDSHITGIPSGFTAVDAVTHGWQPSDLIILAARPSVGKTAFALNISRNATRILSPKAGRRKVLLFSLEMSAGQLVDRLLASESETWMDRIVTGRMEEHHLRRIFERGVQPLAEAGIFIDDTAALNVYELRSRARYTLRRYGKPGDEWMIVVDYLQLMSGVEDRRIHNREQEISNISRNLKKLAKELNIPIIALSQLSREVERRKGEKMIPRLSDLRESGAIEQDADMVMFLYRPEYYDIESDGMGESTRNLVELVIAKNRSGQLATGPGTIKLKADLSIQKFSDWDSLEAVKEKLGSGAWKSVAAAGNKNDDLPF